jgi:hypothetical protein
MTYSHLPENIPFQNPKSIRTLRTLARELGGVDIAYFTPAENAARGLGNMPYSIHIGIAVDDGDMLEVLPPSTGQSPDEALANLIHKIYQSCVVEGMYLIANHQIFSVRKKLVNLLGDPDIIVITKCPDSVTRQNMTVRSKPGGPRL